MQFTSRLDAEMRRVLAPLMCGKCGGDECTCASSPVIEGYSSYSTRALKRWGLDERPPMETIMREFYGSMAAAVLTENPEPFRVIAKKMADHYILPALVMSCVGESRYVASDSVHAMLRSAKNANTITTDRFLSTNIGKYLALLGREQKHKGGFRKVSQHNSKVTRSGAAMRSVLGLRKPLKPATLLFLARQARNVFRWDTVYRGSTSGIGGPLWGQGADLAVQYLEGRLPPAVFVDQALDMMHNGGAILNKVWSFSSTHLEFLTYKRYATPEEVLLYSTPWVRRTFDLPEAFSPPLEFVAFDAKLVQHRDETGVEHTAEELGSEVYANARRLLAGRGYQWDGLPIPPPQGKLWAEWLPNAVTSRPFAETVSATHLFNTRHRLGDATRETIYCLPLEQVVLYSSFSVVSGAYTTAYYEAAHDTAGDLRRVVTGRMVAGFKPYHRHPGHTCTFCQPYSYN